jgi:hypothetical protein
VFLKFRSNREKTQGKFKKAFHWVVASIYGFCCCSCCCHFCGSHKSAFMTKEDEEEYCALPPEKQWQVNCMDGAIGTLGACCCCGGCLGGCGNCGPYQLVYTLEV